MNEAQLIKYLEENLRLDKYVEYSSNEDPDTIKIILYLGTLELSSLYIS